MALIATLFYSVRFNCCFAFKLAKNVIKDDDLAHQWLAASYVVYVMAILLLCRRTG